MPGYVESAAIELAHVSTATAIADVTSNWLAAHHGRAAVVDRIDVRRGGRARRWTVALGDEVDLLRTHRIGDRLLFTAVRGVRDATLSPDRALSYYSRVQRLRAIGTQG